MQISKEQLDEACVYILKKYPKYRKAIGAFYIHTTNYPEIKYTPEWGSLNNFMKNRFFMYYRTKTWQHINKLSRLVFDTNTILGHDKCNLDEHVYTKQLNKILNKELVELNKNQRAIIYEECVNDEGMMSKNARNIGKNEVTYKLTWYRTTKLLKDKYATKHYSFADLA